MHFYKQGLKIVITKWIILIIIVFLIYWSLRSLQQAKKKSAASKMEIEDMVCCAHCGLHIPRSESITADKKHFCSLDHRQLYLKSSQ